MQLLEGFESDIHHRLYRNYCGARYVLVSSEHTVALIHIPCSHCSYESMVYTLRKTLCTSICRDRLPRLGRDLDEGFCRHGTLCRPCIHRCQLRILQLESATGRLHSTTYHQCMDNFSSLSRRPNCSFRCHTMAVIPTTQART